jgi:hypothetical protein
MGMSGIKSMPDLDDFYGTLQRENQVFEAFSIHLGWGTE